MCYFLSARKRKFKKKKLSFSCNKIQTRTISTTKTIPNGAKLGGSGNLSVVSGGILQLSTGNSAAITLGGSTTVENGGIVLGNFTLTAVNLDVQTGGSFSANGTGYNASSGPSPGVVGGNGGAAHAGAGGIGSSSGDPGTTIYGSQTQPVTFGSGGATISGGNGTSGGGALKLNLSGTLTVNGTLSANGSGPSGRGGAGAGGSIWIIAADLAGAGTISANGGTSSGSSGIYGGAGGGGRIAIYGSAHMFHGSVTVSGGTNTITTSDLYSAYAGSLYVDSSVGLCDSGTLSTTCTISGDVTLSNGWAISGSGNLVVANGATLKVQNPTDTITIAMGGDVTINGTISANISSLSAYNVTISSTGSLNANATGYEGGKPQATGSGPGAGVYALSWGGGGSHAGTGGAGGGGAAGGAVGGSTYGSASNPTTMGSGGGGSSCALGANGGGLIKITASNTLTIDGTLSANGGNGTTKSGTCNNSGSGAGGSINVTAAFLTGSGSISAVGGDAGATSGGGGGGGGRIYINAPNPFRGSSSTTAIKFSGGDGKNTASALSTLSYNGTNGSLYYGQMPCDSGLPSTTCTISNYVFMPTSASTVSGNLVIANGGNLVNRPLHLGSLNVTGSLTIQNGGNINANLYALNAGSLDVQAGGTISANGLGYQGIMALAGIGSGGGALGSGASGQAGSGGAYGGNGGGGFSATAGGSYYGSASKASPTSFGSSGGGATSGTGTGGAGGGALRINVTGNLNIAGTISADGSTGNFSIPSGSTGGGSGGSVWLSAGTISGNGIVSAKGGAALGGNTGGNYCSGSGGGGRIAYDNYTTNTFSGTWSASGGSIPGTCGFFVTGGAPAATGGVGSICDKSAGAGCIN